MTRHAAPSSTFQLPRRVRAWFFFDPKKQSYFRKRGQYDKFRLLISGKRKEDDIRKVGQSLQIVGWSKEKKEEYMDNLNITTVRCWEKIRRTRKNNEKNHRDRSRENDH
ncbi:Phenylalanine--tRNA ligase beta subunit [Trichinella spiralis]|uniref:Phenylalanine--tRNA ligase beta subunit n=1 Tax=Trichinella spiralis TaxID=6334 RepID=A0ABR3L2V3_TRISP